MQVAGRGPKAEIDGIKTKFSGSLVTAVFDGEVEDSNGALCIYARYPGLYRWTCLEMAGGGIIAEQEWFASMGQRGFKIEKRECADCHHSFNKGDALPRMNKQNRFYSHAMWNRLLCIEPLSDPTAIRPNLRRCVHCRHKEIIRQTKVRLLRIMCSRTTIPITSRSVFCRNQSTLGTERFPKTSHPGKGFKGPKTPSRKVRHCQRPLLPTRAQWMDTQSCLVP